MIFNVQPWAIKVIVSRRLLNKLYYDVKKRVMISAPAIRIIIFGQPTMETEYRQYIQ